MISHEDLRAQLEELGAVIEASELHGHLCGRLVVGQTIVGPFGKKILGECLGLSPEEVDASAGSFTELAEQITALLEKDLFSFQLFLPSDIEAMSTRLEALSEWCQGFLAGLASSAGLGDSDVMIGENATINDLIEITQVSLDIDESDESEELFVEVCEYVRLAVFNLFDQFRLQDGESVSTGVEQSIH